MTLDEFIDEALRRGISVRVVGEPPIDKSQSVPEHEVKRLNIVAPGYEDRVRRAMRGDQVIIEV